MICLPHARSTTPSLTRSVGQGAPGVGRREVSEHDDSTARVRGPSHRATDQHRERGRPRRVGHRREGCLICRFRRKLLQRGTAADKHAGQRDCSPRVRGWTPTPPPAVPTIRLLPARAGMDPMDKGTSPSGRSAPRACGDGPSVTEAYVLQRYCSPRVRGWTPRQRRRRPRPPLLPARAGMDPTIPFLPRAASPAPRACGDGPQMCRRLGVEPVCSPRVRGWTRVEARGVEAVGLLPARAGMNPPGTCRSCGCWPAPRARGAAPANARTAPPRPLERSGTRQVPAAVRDDRAGRNSSTNAPPSPVTQPPPLPPNNSPPTPQASAPTTDVPVPVVRRVGRGGPRPRNRWRTACRSGVRSRRRS